MKHDNAHLGDYPTMPLYNIKAVVQATGITPSTLRAWERRYNMCQPQRSETGYRLYSERDLAVIRWLKSQVDAGMTISQAVNWMNSIVEEAGGQEEAILPPTGAPEKSDATRPTQHRVQTRDYPALQHDLISALLEFDEARADAVMSEAFSMYAVEEIGENVITPVLVEIGDRWHRRDVSSTTEHFATNYLLQRLSVLLRSIPASDPGALIWVACAPGELHEVGSMLLTLYLRRAGYLAHYFGQNVQREDVVAAVERHRPAIILLSASSEESAAKLAEVTGRLADIDSYQPVIGYGGRIFDQRPELRSGVAGVYMGATALDAVSTVDEVLREGIKPSGRR